VCTLDNERDRGYQRQRDRGCEMVTCFSARETTPLDIFRAQKATVGRISTSSAFNQTPP
jgi:hypothetical protein